MAEKSCIKCGKVMEAESMWTVLSANGTSDSVCPDCFADSADNGSVEALFDMVDLDGAFGYNID